MFNLNMKFNNYYFYISLIYFSWIISIFLYFIFDDYVKAGTLVDGVKLGTDSHYYFKVVNDIISGEASLLDYKSKIGFLSFLYPFIYFDLPLFYIVVIQFFLTAISAICLYKITSKYFCKLSGIICMAIFLFYFPLQIRNFYILTEILFIDLSIIFIYFLVFFEKKIIPIIFTIFVLLVSIRPNGILFLFSLLLSIFLFLNEKKKYKYFFMYFIFLSFLTLPLINILNSYLQDLNMIEHLINKGIIWGWSFENNEICENSCLALKLENNNLTNSIAGFFNFVLLNLSELLFIFIQKIFWLLVRIRPYYSDLHNFYILFFLLLIYPTFIFGFIKKPKNDFSLNVILFYILFSIILVGFTFADWSGRFSLYFLPFIMIFSSYGILIFLRNIFHIFKKN